MRRESSHTQPDARSNNAAGVEAHVQLLRALFAALLLMNFGYLSRLFAPDAAVVSSQAQPPHTLSEGA
jgi:hypothetical protein